MSLMPFLGAGALFVWLHLLVLRGMFWLARERDSGELPALADWPRVVAIVPARDEIGTVRRCLESLLGQDYRGDFHVILVDDQSADGTGAAARTLRDGRLTVLQGLERPAGWTGKLWALHQGIAEAVLWEPDYYWLTDADIVHEPDVLSRLVARAKTAQLDMVSLMVQLHCASPAEKALVPAFVFFFQMLFPFAWVNDPSRATAAAAGGCSLIRSEALSHIGGIASVRGEIIDDCAFARRLKAHGPIWLGLTQRSVSLRQYVRLGEFGRVIARSAYAQLKFSPMILLATLLGMTIAFVGPPLAAILGAGSGRLAGALAWLFMALAFQPVLRRYRRSALWGIALPAIGAVYGAFTVQSAIEYWRGRGGLWKGRFQAPVPR